MASTTESIIARLGLDNSDFKKGLLEAGQTTAETVTKMNETLEGLQKGLAAGAIGEFTEKILENADAVDHQSKILEIGTDQLQAFQFKAREMGASTEDANRALAATKSHLDELRAGNEGAIDSFGRLGLSAASFEGLDLAGSLEVIARAYASNAERAGAYSAMQEVTGKTGRQLTEVLVSLGQEGFGTFIAQAREAHAVISEQTLRDLAEAKTEFDELKGTIMVGSSEILGLVAKVMGELGGMAGGVVAKIEASGSALDKFRALLRGLDIITSPLAAVMAIVSTEAAKTADKTGETQTHTKEELETLRVSSALQELRAKFEETIAQAAREGLDNQTKIALLKKEIAQHEEAAAKAGSDQLTMQKEINKAAELGLQVRKLENDERDKAIAAELKSLETGRQQLPIEEQVAVIVKEQAIAAADIEYRKSKHIDYTKQQATLEDVTNRLIAARVKLLEDEAGAAAALVGDDQKRADVAKLHLEYLTGQTSRAEVLQETQGLLLRNAEDLSDADRQRLSILADELTPQEKQIEIQKILANGIDNLSSTDMDRLRVLTNQTSEYTKQRDRLGDIYETLSKISVIESHGIALPKTLSSSDVTDKSTASLQGTLDQYQRIVDQLNGTKSGWVDPHTGTSSTGAEAVSGFFSTNFAIAQLGLSINAIQQELGFRTNFANAYNQGGDAGAMNYLKQQGGDTLSFDKYMSSMQSTWSEGLDKVSQQSKDQTDEIKKITSTLEKLANG